MLLAVDAGNTHTVVGLYPGPDGSGELVDHWRVSTVAERTGDELALLVGGLLAAGKASLADLTGLVLASGVPRVTAAVRELAARHLDLVPLVVEPGVRTGMPILYDSPKEVGADRIANAVGAVDRYPAPIVVVDFGTATTFDAISARGEYLGGVIVPGVEIGLDALFSRAAALPRVQPGKPRRVIGRGTVESIQSGAVHGAAALVDGMIARMEPELGEPTVVATGGLASLIAPLCRRVRYQDPWLTLHGLRLIFARNQT
ncbi:MAG: type III pantothenate kinase [Acidimicrobiales bacterium]